MHTCRTRPSTSPTETSPSTSAPRSSPAATSRRRSPRHSAATSTSRRDDARASTRSSSAWARSQAGRSASSASSSASGPTPRPAASRSSGSTAAGPASSSSTSSAARVDDGRRRGQAGRLARLPRHRQHQLRHQARRVDARGRRVARRAPRARSRRSSTTWSPARPAAGRRRPRHLTSPVVRPSRPPVEARCAHDTGQPCAIGRHPRRPGCASRSASRSSSTASTSRSPEGRSSPCSGPNGAGKTTTVHILSTLIAADGGEVQVAGHDVAREPDAVRAAIGVTGQFSAVDALLTGEENLRLMADLRHLGKAEGRAGASPSCSSGSTSSRPRSKPVSTYSGRHATPARPGDDPRRRPPDHLPRRADGRTRSPQPPRRCGRSIRDLVDERRHDLPDDAVPRGGGSARRPDRGPRPRPARRRGHAGRAQAPGPGRPHPTRVRRRGRARQGRPAPSTRDPRRRGAGPPGPERRRHRLAAGRSSTGSMPRRSTSTGSSVADARPRRRLPVPHRRPRCREGSRVDDRANRSSSPIRRRCCGGTSAACAATRR